MKKPEAVMEILEAYDLTGSFRAAAGLVGCDHKTVAYWVRQRDEAGGMPVVERSRPAMERCSLAKIEELVDRSHGQIRADKAHGKLVAIGYQGSERTTRRWVAEAKRRWRRKHGRRTRPWIPEPGLWMQWDYGDGPKVDGVVTVLFCAWLAWSRFRVVVPLRDKTLPSVVLGLDRALRVFGGCPTYALTDNEKTVSVDHVCGIAVRNPQIVEVARHYGLTIATCVPADPESKGGSEATVRIAKADLVPTDHNLRPAYRSLRASWRRRARRSWRRSTRVRIASTMEPPVIRLAEEHERLAPAAEVAAHDVLRGDPQGELAVADQRGWRAVLGPARAVDQRVWARSDGERAGRGACRWACGAAGGRPAPADHARAGRAICDEHYPPRPEGALERRPRARTEEERAFLALGRGAEAWLIKAAAAGAQRVRRKMAEAIDLAKLHGTSEVDHALARALTPAGSVTVTSHRSSPTISRLAGS